MLSMWITIIGHFGCSPDDGGYTEYKVKVPKKSFLSFFLSLVSKTQANHWTKRMLNTRLVQWLAWVFSGLEDKGPSSF